MLKNVSENLDGSYSFYGENMTAYSKIFVNGERRLTQFLNNTRIEMKEKSLEEGDVIVISQLGSGNRVFRSSIEYVYHEGSLVPASEYVPPEKTSKDATEKN